MQAESSRFYLVSEVGRALGVAATTVRDWERSGRIEAIRTQNGVRIFSSQEVDRVRKDRERHIKK
jgi:DNA-binding transcriptional MerR regulator